LIRYEYDRSEVEISESRNNNDYQYLIRLVNINKHLDALHDLRHYFNRDNIHTDVMFFVHSDHEYQVIVREDHYVDFLIVLFKFKLVTLLEWV
jgi:hypothetical protein